MSKTSSIHSANDRFLDTFCIDIETTEQIWKYIELNETENTTNVYIKFICNNKKLDCQFKMSVNSCFDTPIYTISLWWMVLKIKNLYNNNHKNLFYKNVLQYE